MRSANMVNVLHINHVNKVQDLIAYVYHIRIALVELLN